MMKYMPQFQIEFADLFVAIQSVTTYVVALLHKPPVLCKNSQVLARLGIVQFSRKTASIQKIILYVVELVDQSGRNIDFVTIILIFITMCISLKIMYFFAKLYISNYGIIDCLHATLVNYHELQK